MQMNAQEPRLKLDIRPDIRTRSPRELLIFGLDDTLVDTGLYWLARTAFARAAASKTGKAEENIVSFFGAPNAKGQRPYEAIAADSPVTMQDAWAAFQKVSDPPPQYDDTDMCLLMARSLRSKFPTLIPGAEELLKWAKPRFTLALLASGDSEIQLRKLEAAKLVSFFHTVKVVPSKRREDFLAVIAELGFAPRNSWVLGDSIGSEINPALAAGANCIQFTPSRPRRTGAQEQIEEPAEPIFRIHELLDARAILANAGPSLAAC